MAFYIEQIFSLTHLDDVETKSIHIQRLRAICHDSSMNVCNFSFLLLTIARYAKQSAFQH